MARAKGSKNRNYPPLTLGDALRVPRAIQDEASGMTTTRLTLAEYLDTTPSSSTFRDLVASSRAYDLTDGGINAAQYSLTQLGEAATGADEIAQIAAFKQAVLKVAPFRTFFEAYSGKKVPANPSFKEFLKESAAVPEERLDDCVSHILADAATAGLTRTVKGANYVDLEGVPSQARTGESDEEDTRHEAGSEGAELARIDPSDDDLPSDTPSTPVTENKPKKVFIAHGKNHTPLDQLKDALGKFKVQFAVAINEPNAGRPISRKVAALMREECSSGIFIFTADERFLREMNDGTQEEVWRPSENVVYELGAASILYENRIVIFKERGVSFPSDFSDLGYIEFEKDQLVAELGSLFSELVALDILEVRAKG
jgi:predicted nucleotide-binding protein